MLKGASNPAAESGPVPRLLLGLTAEFGAEPKLELGASRAIANSCMVAPCDINLSTCVNCCFNVAPLAKLDVALLSLLPLSDAATADA